MRSCNPIRRIRVGTSLKCLALVTTVLVLFVINLSPGLALRRTAISIITPCHKGCSILAHVCSTQVEVGLTA